MICIKSALLHFFIVFFKTNMTMHLQKTKDIKIIKFKYLSNLILLNLIIYIVKLLALPIVKENILILYYYLPLM